MNRSGRTEGISDSQENQPLPVRIEAIEGPGAGARVLLEHGSLIVGSGEGCGLRLEDRAVSNQHAELQLLPGEVRVRDLGSRNGTVYLGARIEQARVPFGGSIKVGRTTLRLHAALEELPASTADSLEGLLGTSVAMRKLFTLVQRVAATDVTVLIQGETGTGKDSVARAIHNLSARRAGPFIVFDCASVNPNLIEAELFGYVKGAFTGANQTRAGAVELAQGGTLFLDEIGELPVELQSRLLRLLEARQFKRVGDTLVRSTNARIISATHKDLEAETQRRKFRQDLFFRLAVAQLRVPPLRERPEDIALLAAHFARRATGQDVPLKPTTLAALQCDAWPGNVRELRNAVERVVALGVTAVEEPAKPEPGTSYQKAREQLLEAFERDYLESLLKRNKGNVAAAAREAGLSRSQLYRLLERRNIKA